MVDGLVIVPVPPADREEACRVFERTIPEAFAGEELGHLMEESREEIDLHLPGHRCRVILI